MAGVGCWTSDYAGDVKKARRNRLRRRTAAVSRPRMKISRSTPHTWDLHGFGWRHMSMSALFDIAGSRLAVSFVFSVLLGARLRGDPITDELFAIPLPRAGPGCRFLQSPFAPRQVFPPLDAFTSFLGRTSAIDSCHLLDCPDSRRYVRLRHVCFSDAHVCRVTTPVPVILLDLPWPSRAEGPTPRRGGTQVRTMRVRIR